MRMKRVKNNMEKAGFNNFRFNLAAVDMMMPAPKRATPPRMASPVARAPRTASPMKRAYDPKTNMVRYSVNNVGKFRIAQRLCNSYSRKELDRMAMKVGLNPKDFKNVKALCAAIMTKVDLKPYKTAARIERNQNKMMNEFRKGYEKNNMNKVKKYEEMRKKIKEMESKNINEKALALRVGAGRVVKRSEDPKRRLALFKIVGLKK